MTVLGTEATGSGSWIPLPHTRSTVTLQLAFTERLLCAGHLLSIFPLSSRSCFHCHLKAKDTEKKGEVTGLKGQAAGGEASFKAQPTLFTTVTNETGLALTPAPQGCLVRSQLNSLTSLKLRVRVWKETITPYRMIVKTAMGTGREAPQGGDICILRADSR